MSASDNSGHFEESQEGRYCPSCGRYVGHHSLCPYCGARVKVRVSLKVLAIISLILAVSGVIAIYFAAHSKAPTVLVEQITPEMNYARVRVVGYVVSAPYYDDISGRLSFRIVDLNWTYNEYFNTSNIIVNVYPPTSLELIRLGRIPVLGDKVEVVGTLKLRGYIAMAINYEEDLNILREAPVSVSIDEIANNWGSMIGKSVTVDGWVVEYSNYSGMLLLKIKDYYSTTQYKLSVYIPEIVYKWLGNMTDFFLGDKIEITGNIWEYRGEPELVPWNASSIVLIEKLEIMPLAEILANTSFYGEANVIVMVNVTVVGYHPTYHNIVYVTDSSTASQVTIFIDWEVWDSLGTEAKQKLNTIGFNFVTIGMCTFYKSSFEIAVYDPSWLILG